MTRIGRIVSVTLGLMGAGFVFGALAGGAAFSTVLLMDGEGISLGAFAFGALYGAPLGAVIAPLLSWLLLRRVPLGLMFLVCSIGTTIGGIVGWVTTPSSGDVVVQALLGAFIGCTVAATALWLRVRRGASALP
jgi:hypothetical protein